jgi:hypothetical protein
MKNNSPVPTDKLYRFVNRASLAPRRITEITEIIENRRKKANLFKNLWLDQVGASIRNRQMSTEKSLLMEITIISGNYNCNLALIVLMPTRAIGMWRLKKPFSG